MSPHFHIPTGALQHAALLAATKSTTTKPTTGSSSSLIFFVIIIIALVYFLLIRPQRTRARRAQQVQGSMEIGDEVMLTSGIIGRITWLEGDRARIEISPGTEIEVVKQALGRKVTAPVSDADIAVPADEDTTEHTEGDGNAVTLPYGQDGQSADSEKTSSSIDDLLAKKPVAGDGDDEEGT